MLTRRSLLKSATAAAVSSSLSRRSFASESAPAPAPLRQFDYTAVTLLPGPLHEQFDYHHRLLLSLDNDMLLKPLREIAGVPAPGDNMGGWYSVSPFFDPHGSFEGFCPGHSFGQYLSALARAYAITGDPGTRTKVEGLVAGLAPALTSRLYANYPLPCYLEDKICIGLLDAYTLAGTASARPVLDQNLAAALPHMPEKALSRAEQISRPHAREVQTWDESYTVPENLFLAYQKTGRPAFRDAAVRFLEDDLYFNPLSEDIDVLGGEHAYSHVNAFSSAMQAYITLGSAKHLRAATNAFRMLEAQSFATGGWGPSETLLRPNTDDLARSLFTQQASFETPCGAYAHFKVTRYLLRVTGDPHYGDSMERVLYNTVLGAKPILPDGSSFYYSDFTLTGHKTYARDKWPCCSGTLPQIAADYGISTYLSGTPKTSTGVAADLDGISVVLFVPSRVTFGRRESPVTLTQQTTYPAQPATALAFELAAPASFTVALRIPAWSGPATHVLVNGKPAEGEVRPGSFFALRRTWKDGDRIEVSFDMPLRTEHLKAAAAPGNDIAVPQPSAPLTASNGANVDPLARETPPSPIRLAALLRGPVVFMATGAWPTTMRESHLLAAEVATAGDRLSVASEAKEPVTFKPYTAVQEETYRTYQPLQKA